MQRPGDSSRGSLEGGSKVSTVFHDRATGRLVWVIKPDFQGSGPSPSLIRAVALSKLLNIPTLQFSHYKTGMITVMATVNGVVTTYQPLCEMLFLECSHFADEDTEPSHPLPR